MMAADRREFFRRGLSSNYAPLYDELCAKLGPEWQPYSGVRTFNQQTALWNQGRSSSGNIITNAKAGESGHNYGCASDWAYFVGEKLIWLPKDDPRWTEYIDAVTSVGLRPGAEFGDVDHNELRLDCSWSHVLIAFNAGNMVSAQNKIFESIVIK